MSDHSSTPEPVEIGPADAPAMLNAALALARDDFAVLPVYEPGEDGQCSCGGRCGSPAKHPRTRNGLNAASADLDQVHDWWTRWPRANIGIRTGEDAGVFVLDIDPPHGGDESLAQLTQRNGELPATLEQRTGSGGRHLFFRHPGGAIKNSVGKLGAGLDIRGDGGYVLVAPSRNTTGAYTLQTPSGRLVPRHA